MNIRTRLTIQFVSIVAMLMLFSSVAIYYFSTKSRYEDFYQRLKSKATNTAKILIDIDEIDAALLLKIERDNPSSLPYEKIKVYDYKNELIFTTDQTNLIKVDNDLIDKIRLNKEVRFTQNDFEVLGFLFTSRYDRFVVITAAKDIYGYNKLKDLGGILSLVFGVSIVLISITGWFYSGRALAPISGVVKEVDSITISKLNTRVNEGDGNDEISRLAKTFNKMLDRLEAAFKVQKNFIANASHELRTPLTAITGQVEVTLMKAANLETYKETLESVLDDMHNLNVISNRLLILAQTDTDNAKSDFKILRIDEAIWQARSELLKLHPHYVINVLINKNITDDKSLCIIGNEALIKTAIVNLMDNACKYSPNHAVDVRLESEKNLTLKFSDRGIGMSEEDLKYIFEPFYRGNNVSKIKGHGIGLSLVNRIIKLHDGHINIISRINLGSSFTITLPLVAAIS